MAKHRNKKKADQRNKPPRGARPFWSGTISFGLVSVPVYLFPATHRMSISLRLLDDDGTPLARRYYCPQDERDIHPEHILRGYQVAEEEYVVVRDAELEALEPQKSREIDLRQFVELAEISPMFFDRPYFLTPAGDTNKAYRLLAAVMEDSGRAGIATFVMRDREYLIAILADGGILRAQTLRFDDELRNPSDIGLPELEKSPAKEVSRLESTIKKHTADALDAEQLKDEYAQRVRKLVEKKRKRNEDVVEVEREAPSEVDADDGAEEVDLLETIRRSLQAGDGVRSHNGKHRKNTKSRSAARPKLEDMSKEQLYDRAKQLDIPGRSKLTKTELIRAIGRTKS